MLIEITLILDRKFEGHIFSGIGSRSVPVIRQAVRQKHYPFKFFKIFYWTNIAAFGLSGYIIVRAVVTALR